MFFFAEELGEEEAEDAFAPDMSRFISTTHRYSFYLGELCQTPLSQKTLLPSATFCVKVELNVDSPRRSTRVSRYVPPERMSNSC